MCETLLLANPDTNTLRPVRSRASTVPRQPARPHAYCRPHFVYELVAWSTLAGLRGSASRITPDVYLLLRFMVRQLVGCTDFRRVRPHAFWRPCFPSGLAAWFAMRTNLVDGFTRIARGVPWAGSVTGGEAWGIRVRRKRGSHIRGSGEHRAFGAPMNKNCTLWTLRVVLLKAFSLLRFFVAKDQEMTRRHAKWLIVMKKTSDIKPAKTWKAATWH